MEKVQNIYSYQTKFYKTKSIIFYLFYFVCLAQHIVFTAQQSMYTIIILYVHKEKILNRKKLFRRLVFQYYVYDNDDHVLKAYFITYRILWLLCTERQKCHCLAVVCECLYVCVHSLNESYAILSHGKVLIVEKLYYSSTVSVKWW